MADSENTYRRQPRAARPPVLDPLLLAEIRELQVAGEPDCLTEMVQSFLENTPRRMAEIRMAVTARDAAVLEFAAHALRGACGIFGAQGMIDLSQALEECGRLREMAPASSLLAALEVEYELLQQALAEIGSGEDDG